MPDSHTPNMHILAFGHLGVHPIASLEAVVERPRVAIASASGSFDCQERRGGIQGMGLGNAKPRAVVFGATTRADLDR
jgi:hypothetical protein